MSTSLKVPVATLIAKAEAERQRIIAKHSKAVAGYTNKLPEAMSELVDRLYSVAGDIDARHRATLRRLKPRREYSSATGGYVERLSVSVHVDMPVKPAARPDTTKVDRDIQLLRATSQETISVRTDSDFMRYL